VFTGIVEELGEVVGVTELPDAARIAIRGSAVIADAGHGDSIAVSGVCLTVVGVDRDVFTADVMHETLVRSALGDLRAGDRVNLERAVTMATRLGGHLVQGHVDGTGVLLSRTPGEHWEVLRFSLPEQLSRYVVEKGSIAVDGVSLTVTAVGDQEVPDGWFEVSLIPTTLTLTTLGAKTLGAAVNLEVDVMAKYVERLLGARIPSAVL
jgi:riboflavin synthase